VTVTRHRRLEMPSLRDRGGRRSAHFRFVMDRGSDLLRRTTSKGPRGPSRAVIGLISDTHGLIRPEALEALRGSDLIMHCGDVGDPAVLEALRTLAPVRAIRGNNDRGPWANHLPPQDLVEVGGHAIRVLHSLVELDPDTDPAGLIAVVFGHSHKPLIEKR